MSFGTLWEDYFRNHCIKRINFYIDTLEKRILPVYDNIEQEAEKISEDKWEEYMSLPGDGSLDPSDFVDDATGEGVEYYLIMSGQKQALLNLSVTVLYHLSEQHLLFFHRKQMLSPGEEKSLKLLNTKKLRKLLSTKELWNRLKNHNIDVEKFSFWSIFDEIRIVNNVVKHAEGESALELKSKRPDLFEPPELIGFSSTSKIIDPWVYLPMAGEDLYISLDNLKRYKKGLIDFLEEFINALHSA
ncbi:MAG: hypothetical protein CV087_09010 [Candidatus Brocadia sp. WS118]|nr:MAG: hypothetical protein CV087_09010 [Candidatus Brocadia sp. WS118]